MEERGSGSSSIGLADAIENLRSELAEAMARGEGKELRFALDQIELELALNISREAGGEGKVEFKVFGSGVEIGGKGGQSWSNAHRIRLVLKLPEKSGPHLVVDPSKLDKPE